MKEILLGRSLSSSEDMKDEVASQMTVVHAKKFSSIRYKLIVNAIHELKKINKKNLGLLI